MNAIISVIGAIFLVFRIWLTNFKLQDELEFRRYYVSRFLNYYFCLAMVLAFQNEIFNIMIITVLPMMVISLVGWDSLFFVKFKKRTYWKKNHGWLIIERLTLHPPIVTVAIWMIITGIHNFFTLPPTIWPFISGGILFYGVFFLLDERITKKYIPPTGANMVFGSLVSFIGMIFIVFYFY